MRGLKALLVSLLVILNITNVFGNDISISDDETVYAITRPDGSIEKTVVVDWIRIEGNGEYTVYDTGTGLSNIRRLLGDAKVSLSSNRVKIEGKVSGISDIYYRGDTKKKLPLSLSIDYYLNGQRATYETAKGKRGTLRIELTVKNNLQRRVRIGNGEEEVYLPFTAIITGNFPSSKIRDIKVSEGGGISVAGSNINVTIMGMPQPIFRCWLEINMERIELSSLQIAVVPSSPALTDLVKGFSNYIGSIEQMDQILKFQQDLLRQMSQEIKTSIEGSNIETSLDDISKMREKLNRQEDIINEILKTVTRMIDRNSKMISLVKKMGNNRELLDLLEEDRKELEAVQERLSTFKSNNKELSKFFSDIPVDSIRNVMNSLSRIQMSLNAIAEGGFVGFVMIPGINMVREGIKTAKQEIEKSKEKMDILEMLAKSYDTFIGKPSNAKKSSVRFVYHIKFE